MKAEIAASAEDGGTCIELRMRMYPAFALLVALLSVGSHSTPHRLLCNARGVLGTSTTSLLALVVFPCHAWGAVLG